MPTLKQDVKLSFNPSSETRPKFDNRVDYDAERADENEPPDVELPEENKKVPMMADENSSKYKAENEQYEAEKKAGDPSDLFTTNQHHSYPQHYKDFGRRFVLQYPYKDASNTPETVLNEDEEAEANLDKIIKDFHDENVASSRLKPVKAPPEFVLKVAKESALLEASKPINPSEYLMQKDILRSGNYWNGVWREDVDPKTILRSKKGNDMIESVKVSITPGSKLYQLVTALKKISPKLIYVINKD